MNSRLRKFYLAIGSAILNTVGALLVGVSFQAASTPFLLVVERDGKAYLCVGKQALFSLDAKGALGMGTQCGDTTNAKPAAVVNFEHPILGILGFMFIVFGFGMQLFSLEKPRPAFTSEEMQEIRNLRRLLKENRPPP